MEGIRLRLTLQKFRTGKVLFVLFPHSHSPVLWTQGLFRGDTLVFWHRTPCREWKGLMLKVEMFCLYFDVQVRKCPDKTTFLSDFIVYFNKTFDTSGCFIHNIYTLLWGRIRIVRTFPQSPEDYYCFSFCRQTRRLGCVGHWVGRSTLEVTWKSKSSTQNFVVTLYYSWLNLFSELLRSFRNSGDIDGRISLETPYRVLRVPLSINDLKD